MFQEGLSEEFVKAIGQIDTAFKFDIKPKLTEDGTSGSYFLKNESRNNIVFKIESNSKLIIVFLFNLGNFQA